MTEAAVTVLAVAAVFGATIVGVAVIAWCVRRSIECCEGIADEVEKLTLKTRAGKQGVQAARDELTARYRLDVHYPVAAYYEDSRLDQMIETVAERRADHCGMGSMRDLGFEFWTAAERDAVADAITAENIPMVSVVRRTDLDPKS